MEREWHLFCVCQYVGWYCFNTCKTWCLIQTSILIFKCQYRQTRCPWYAVHVYNLLPSNTYVNMVVLESSTDGDLNPDLGRKKTLCAFKKHLPYLKTCFVLGNFCRNAVPALLPRAERILMRVCGISVFSFWSEELHGETTAPVALTSQSGFKTTVNAVRTCWMVLTGRHCAAGGLRSSPGAPGLIAAAGSFLLTESDTLKHKNDVWKARKLSSILQDETYDSRGFYLSSLTGKRKEQKEKALMF